MTFATNLTPDQISLLYGLSGALSAFLFWKVLIR